MADGLVDNPAQLYVGFVHGDPLLFMQCLKTSDRVREGNSSKIDFFQKGTVVLSELRRHCLAKQGGQYNLRFTQGPQTIYCSLCERILSFQ